MPYTRREARHEVARMLSTATFAGVNGTIPLFEKVWSSQVKETGGMSPVAMVWNGPLWVSNRDPQIVHTAGLRVGILVVRDDEERSEDILDQGAEAVMQIVKNSIYNAGYWYYIEFAGESYLDFPPIETGEQYRREILDLRVHLQPAQS